MDCNEVRKIIQLYMDNELDARNTLEAQNHIESCSSCLNLLEAYSKQDQLLREAARDEAIDARRLQGNIRAAIRNKPSKAHYHLPAPHTLRRVAAIAVIAIVGALLLLRGGSVPGLNDKVYAAAASDHADHCGFDKLTGAITDNDEIERLVAEFSHLKKKPDLSAFGYTGSRARICPVTGASILHLIYYGSEQKPLSVYTRLHRDQDQISDQLKVLPEEGYTVAAVSRSGVDVFVVSSLDDKQTARILKVVAAQL